MKSFEVDQKQKAQKVTYMPATLCVLFVIPAVCHPFNPHFSWYLKDSSIPKKAKTESWDLSLDVFVKYKYIFFHFPSAKLKLTDSHG